MVEYFKVLLNFPYNDEYNGFMVQDFLGQKKFVYIHYIDSNGALYTQSYKIGTYLSVINEHDNFYNEINGSSRLSWVNSELQTNCFECRQILFHGMCLNCQE